MGKHKIIYFFYLSLFFILCTCNDPVFYAISQEIKPIEPRINGVPTNFAVYEGRMYIASGNVLLSYKYNIDAGEDSDKQYWIRETSPGGNILQIASAGGNLYALCTTDQNNDGKTVLRSLDKDNSSWLKIGGLDNYAKIQNIFAAGDVLFVLAVTSTSSYNYNILCVNNVSDAFNIMGDEEDTGILTGAAFNGESYFLPFTSKKMDKEKISGVYKTNDVNNGVKTIMYKNADGNNINVHFNGIINLEDSTNTILMISRNGEIYYIIGDSIEKIANVSMGRMSTGALAIYTKPPEPGNEPSENPERLLLAGRQDSLYYSSTYGYSYGYMELELDTAGIKNGSYFTEPGLNPLSTLTDSERYQSSLGKYPINYLFQVPPDIDSNMTLFASTQKSGVWSCRDRDKNYNKYWNAEGEDEPEKYDKNES